MFFTWQAFATMRWLNNTVSIIILWSLCCLALYSQNTFWNFILEPYLWMYLSMQRTNSFLWNKLPDVHVPNKTSMNKFIIVFVKMVDWDIIFRLGRSLVLTVEVVDIKNRLLKSCRKWLQKLSSQIGSPETIIKAILFLNLRYYKISVVK